uniref:Uncharacterized protein n=1 Tax=Oryza glumipatula TaxID=40148 RepID=A0A0D9YP62_9ORYZ
MGDGDAGRLRFPWPGVVFRGMLPTKLLAARERRTREERLPSVGAIAVTGGIEPAKLLRLRDELFAKNSGILPLIASKINIYKRRATAQQWWYVTCEGVVGEIQSFQLTKRPKSSGYTAFKLVVV